MLRINIYTKSLHIFDCEEPKQIPIRIWDILMGFCLGQAVKWSVLLHLDSNLQPQVLWLRHGTTSANRPRSSFCSPSSTGRMQWKIVNVMWTSIFYPFLSHSHCVSYTMNAPQKFFAPRPAAVSMRRFCTFGSEQSQSMPGRPQWFPKNPFHRALDNPWPWKSTWSMPAIYWEILGMNPWIL